VTAYRGPPWIHAHLLTNQTFSQQGNFFSKMLVPCKTVSDQKFIITMLVCCMLNFKKYEKA